ncbi:MULTISPECIES: NADH-quinone oxidoreductase subunit NuoK [unclassified Schaalia]|uniref:NADH-quinone oxidoreductase subunit NuoK n=1 Tax=unclassified Schaalia TaxID=2691889 RepID=UPI0015F71A84|nr:MULTISPECIES: NADH-quinone oxidoreductase subunit NuoK [unclassified Schaalia]
MSLAFYIALAGILFSIGAVTVVVRKSVIISLLGVELMLNSASLVFITFSRVLGDYSGQVMAFFVMIVAAAEVVVGLSIVVAIFKSRATTDLDQNVALRK